MGPDFETVMYTPYEDPRRNIRADKSTWELDRWMAFPNDPGLWWMPGLSLDECHNLFGDFKRREKKETLTSSQVRVRGTMMGGNHVEKVLDALFTRVAVSTRQQIPVFKLITRDNLTLTGVATSRTTTGAR